MVILGIDPGIAIVGYGVVHYDGHKFTPIEYGAITTPAGQKLTDRLCAHFEKLVLLVDAYTSFAAKMSKRRNPINDVGVTEVYGIDNPQSYQCEELVFVKEHIMTPQKYINELRGFERFVFAKLYAGGFSKKLYRLFEYKKK